MLKELNSQEGDTHVLRIRLKDKHAKILLEKASWVNFVWNYCNELAHKIWVRDRKFLSFFEIDKYTRGASKSGLPLHSQTIQAVARRHADNRKITKRSKLKWRRNSGSHRSLGWVPFSRSAIRYKNGQLWMSGIDNPLSMWDSYGLSDYELGSGNFSEDSRGRWYINICVKKKKEKSTASSSVGIDLGLKDFAVTSDGETIEAKRFYRDSEEKLAKAQRAKKKKQVRNIHAKIKNQRKDFQHKLSTDLIKRYGAIFVGNVNAAGLAKTKMAKSVYDASWSQFRTMLRYKCDSAGVWFEEVNEAFSTVTCSACGSRSGPSGLKDLRIREWTCTECGTHHDRDVNAAKNILRRGHATLDVGIPGLLCRDDAKASLNAN